MRWNREHQICPRDQLYALPPSARRTRIGSYMVQDRSVLSQEEKRDFEEEG